MKAAVAAPALGLPAALLAHALVFGADHAIAGALQFAVFAAGGLFFLIAASLHTSSAIQGSIAASRVRLAAPGFVALLCSGGAWFALIEWCEPRHGIAPVAVAAALALACLLIILAMRSFAAFVAHVTLTIVRGSVPVRAPQFTISRVFEPVLSSQSLAHAVRRFSRPPPAFS